CARGNENFDFW
nr:immunoglobulin heavy chain junction region [Macaca mulatta]MOW32617.1 immunoglobulin heavy chain junction region [Macaca mulatta]MOW32814.1 immunoglobulin heavy chain junction region [Macaca mulatta]MOW33053.1 immunoglobulin heavy chain junction region [Macaca mulatta]MOW33324.1 immunoglobulin heavy chain junction region [Macaca mulatta]